MSVISWSDDSRHDFPGYGTPMAVFSNLTNLFGPGPLTPDTYQVARGKSVIDCVREDLSGLAAST